MDFIKLILDAINSVRSKANRAMKSGNLTLYANKVLDLAALEHCLVKEYQRINQSKGL